MRTKDNIKSEVKKQLTVSNVHDIKILNSEPYQTINNKNTELNKKGVLSSIIVLNFQFNKFR